jgi:hypothetical protein
MGKSQRWHANRQHLCSKSEIHYDRVDLGTLYRLFLLRITSDNLAVSNLTASNSAHGKNGQFLRTFVGVTMSRIPAPQEDVVPTRFIMTAMSRLSQTRFEK